MSSSFYSSDSEIIEKVLPQVRCKVTFLGPSGAGKTSIIYRYKENNFLFDITPTVGAPLHSTVVETSEKSFSLWIWDTAGQERFAKIMPQYYRNSDCIVLCFEHDLPQKALIEQIEKQMDSITHELTQLPMLMVLGNKYDLVSEDENKRGQLKEIVHQLFSNRYQLREGIHYCYLDCSAKNGLNLKKGELFETTLLELLEKQDNLLKLSQQNKFCNEKVIITQITPTEKVASKGCC